MFHEEVDKLTTINQSYSREARFARHIVCSWLKVCSSDKGTLASERNRLPEQFYRVSRNFGAELVPLRLNEHFDLCQIRYIQFTCRIDSTVSSLSSVLRPFKPKGR